MGPAAPGAADSVEVFWRMTPGLEQTGWREHTRVIFRVSGRERFRGRKLGRSRWLFLESGPLLVLPSALGLAVPED